jgi:hypothetical protein
MPRFSDSISTEQLLSAYRIAGLGDQIYMGVNRHILNILRGPLRLNPVTRDLVRLTDLLDKRSVAIRSQLPCQYLQIDHFQFPKEIEVAKLYLQLDVPQRCISEWELELLAKEVILNGSRVALKGRILRAWKTLSELVNSLKELENRIYRQFGSPHGVLVELIRIAHRQFIWQANRPNSASIIRYFKVFNRPAIDKICCEQIGLTVSQTYMCGIACMGFFLNRPAITIPFESEIKALTIELFEKFFAFTSKPIRELKSQLKGEQQYNANFAYAYSSLRAFPLVKMSYRGVDALVCPLMTLLYWRFTGGLYYEFIVPEFANEFGDGFQNYVGKVLERACPDPMQRFGEQEYAVGKAKKRSVDWIIADENAALFLECKAKRLSWGAKVSLTDLGPLEADIDSMSDAVAQVYKTLVDHLDNAYPHVPVRDGRKIFPAVVTLENWRMFGPVMINKLAEAVAAKLNDAGLPADFVERMPYSIWAIEEFEVGLQIMRANGIADFMEGKLNSEETLRWDWHGYMINRYPQSLPAKKLFEKDYEEMFSDLYRAQPAGN